MPNNEKLITCDLVWKTHTSKKGRTFEALFAILPNGKEIIVSFDRKIYFNVERNSN